MSEDITTTAPMPFQKDMATSLRIKIKFIAAEVKKFADTLKAMENNNGTEDRGEEIANAMLSYRHLEDARMRLGKVIEAYEGSNIYEKAEGKFQEGKDE